MIPFGWFPSDLIRLFESPSPPRGRQENGLPRWSARNDNFLPRPHFAFCILCISVLQEALIRLALAGDARATFPVGEGFGYGLPHQRCDASLQ